MRIFSISAILSLFSMSISCTSSMDRIDHGNNSVESWVPSHLTETQIGQVKELIDNERSSVIEKNNSDAGRQFGFSISGVNQIQVLCLQEVKKRYEENTERPKVADFGAGHGFMTWKLIVAGADVFAVEPQEPTRKKLVENANKAKPFLKKGENLGKISRCSENNDNNNVLYFNKCSAYKNKLGHYDVTWSGNLIHLFTPDEATAYVENLYKITKPGGYAFATVHAPCCNREVLSFFLKNQETGKEFPGYFMTNTITFRRQYVRPNPQRFGYLTTVGCKTQFIKAECLPVDTGQASISLSPTITNPRFYEGGTDQESQSDNILTDGYGDRYYTYQNYDHYTQHFFDTESFQHLFEKAQFIVEDVFYMNAASQTRFEAGKLSLEMMTEDKMSIWVGIKAYKQL